MVTLADLLSMTYAPIQTIILSHLSIAEVLTLARSSKTLDLRPILRATAYNMNHHLGRFFADPREFRSI